jgi:uncharacterized protein (DUF885 family)
MLFMRFGIIQISIYLLFNTYILAQTKSFASQELEKLLKNVSQLETKTDAFYGLGEGKFPQELPAQTWEQFLLNDQQYQDLWNQLQKIPNNQLNRQEQITKSIMSLNLQDHLSAVKYKIVFIPFDAEGGFYNAINYRLADIGFRTYQDYQKYLNWLPTYFKYLKQNQTLMEQGIREKIVAPKVIVENNIKLMEVWTSNELDKNPLTIPFAKFPKELTDNEKVILIQQIKDALEKQIAPAYRQLRDFMQKVYLPSAQDKVGIGHIPNGKAYYENRVQHYTTLSISSDSVFNLGLQEVKRIRTAMEKIIAELQFKGSFADFIQFLRTDSQFYPKSPEALLQYAAWLSKKAEGQLPRLFANLYTLPFTVEPVPADIAPYYTGGRYVPGNREKNRAGIYWVNTYQLPSRTLYTLPALTLHEAVPGHHLQIMKTSELKDIPDFRRHYYISAFGEGWGLYAEYLGEEMNMYNTPYELFGRYTYEMWRACRLVVDVGMHYKNWDRAQAVKFMAENTALSLHEVNTEIDRYIGWPGQALSYKIGEIKIKQLRERAEQALGEKFNIQQFHEAILKNGSVTLSILEDEIEEYIKRVK